MTKNIPIPKNPVWRLIFTLISCAFLFGLSANAADVLVFQESFETDGLDSRYTVENGSDDGSGDFFARRQEGSAGTEPSGGTIDGSFFWAGQDIDADGAIVNDLEKDEGRITFNAFDILGVGRLKITIAAGQGGDFVEFDNVMLIQVKFDDGDWATIGGFRGTFTNSPGRYFEGGDNTLPDHNVEPRLTKTFVDFSWEIPGSGDTMQVRIKMNLNGGTEEYAFDNFRVTGDDAVELFSLALDSTTISEEAGAGAATLTVTLENPAPAGGATLAVSTVSPLAVGGPDTEISVPETVEIASGATAGTISVDAVADGRFDGDVEIRIFVEGEGYNRDFITITVTNIDSHPSLLINEFLAQPAGSIPEDLSGDANGDGSRNSAEDEFLEIINTNGDGSSIDLSGWTITDNIGPRHTFPPGTVLDDGRALVIFGGGNPTGIFGGAQVLTASQGNLGFSNNGDTFTIVAGGAVVTAITYEGDIGGSQEAGVRDPDITGDIVLHSLATGSGGALFSPGTRLDGSPFGLFTNTITLALSPDSVSEIAGDAAVTGTITLENAAPAGGLVINIESAGAPDRIDFSGAGVEISEIIIDELLGITVRIVSLTIAAGSTQGTFDIDVFDNEVLSGDREWRIIAKERNTLPGIAPLTVTEAISSPFYVVVNELLSGPNGTGLDPNGNGIAEEGLEDQFIEIVNASGFDVDVSGWIVRIIAIGSNGIPSSFNVHKFANGTVLADEGSFVIFGGGDEVAMNDPMNDTYGGAVVFVANEGENGVNLPTQKDAVILLLNEHGFILDSVMYLIQDADQSQSLTRSPDITGNFPNLHFDVSSAFLLFSPGATTGGAPFAGNGVVDLDVFSGVDIPGFPGWKTSPWYKNYNVDFPPWIYHDEHGWQFVDSGATAAVTFLFDLGLNNWVFVNEGAYRWIFLYGPDEGWIFTFSDNTPGSRFFQRLDDGSLFSVPAGLPIN